MRNHVIGGAMLLALVATACSAARQADAAPDAVPVPKPVPPASAADASLVILGRDAFGQCDGCHSVEPGAPSAAGPNLFGVVGRQAGSLKGYPYTDALAASQVMWDAASLDAYLADPAGFVPGSEMERGMVRDPELRAAIIAYLSGAGEER